MDPGQVVFKCSGISDVIYPDFHRYRDDFIDSAPVFS